MYKVLGVKMKQNIFDLLETVKMEYPKGCKGMSCSEYPLHCPEHAIGHEICQMLAMIEVTVRDYDIQREYSLT
jgi:hypothetical protein